MCDVRVRARVYIYYVCARVRACVHAFVCVFIRACVRASMRICA